MTRRWLILCISVFVAGLTTTIFAATGVTNTTPGDTPSCTPNGLGDCVWGFTATSDTNFGESVCIQVHPNGDAGNFINVECAYVSGSVPNVNWSCTVDMTGNAAFANAQVDYQFFVANSSTSCNDNQHAFTGYNWSFNSGPNAVQLESFTATNNNGTVLLGWETSYEVDHAGFNVYRRVANSRNDWTVVNDSLISSTGTQAQGAVYQFVDTTVDAGTWEYLLEDVETDGDTYQHTDFIATVTAVAPTAISLANLDTMTMSAAAVILLTILLTTTSFVFIKTQAGRGK